MNFAGVRLYQGSFNRTIPNFAMIPASDIADKDYSTNNDPTKEYQQGVNDGVWCQSTVKVLGIGSWKLPNGSAVTDVLYAEPIFSVRKVGQVGLLRSSSIGSFPYQGMYTCTIRDKYGVIQTLVIWIAGNGAYYGSAKSYSEI